MLGISLGDGYRAEPTTVNTEAVVMSKWGLNSTYFDLYCFVFLFIFIFSVNFIYYMCS